MKATIKVKNESIATVDNRIFSSFIEHMGRAVYTGIYEPEHATADAAGFRQDVAELIRPLNLSHIRYPGGNFLSGYRWRDGIGPREKRPMRPELAWQAIEPNEVGTDEFLQWCERLNVNAMLGVNLGTGTPQDAVDLLEYVNGTLPTYYAKLREANGHAAPYGVKLWCLGNEMDGPWQICAKSADEYGRVAAQTAKMMKWLDDTIELVACGSSFKEMPTYGAWERTVLKHCYEYIDYLSLHQYYQNNDDDVPSFLSRSIEMDEFIREVAGICKEAKNAAHGEKDIGLSFDEWNVWYHFQKEGHSPDKWKIARPIEEERYDMTDALLVGCMLNTLIKNADTVKISCLAQLVNVIAPIMTEPGGSAWAQTIYTPFLYASRYGRGTSMRVEISSPAYECAIRKVVPYIDASAVQQADGSTALFIINRSPDTAITCQCIAADGIKQGAKEWLSLHGYKPSFTAQKGAPLKPRNMTGAMLQNGIIEITLPPFSWNLIRLS